MGLISRLRKLLKHNQANTAAETKPATVAHQSVKGEGNLSVQVTGNVYGDISISDPLAQRAFDALKQQMEQQAQQHQASQFEKDQQIKTLHEIILNLSQSKQNHSLPAKQVDSALQAIMDSGDTAQAKALLSQKIDANAKALQQAQQQLIKQQNQLTEQRQQQAKLYFQPTTTIPTAH